MDNFVEAKQEINAIFGRLTKYLTACNKFSADYKIAFMDEGDIDKFPSEVSGFLARVSSISEIISGDQMKVVFFGRTSNGKSTTINAMLQDKILPMGIGHTTNCFLNIHGSDFPDPYILLPGSDDKKDVKSLGQLAHALCKEKLDPSSLVQVFWPKSRCNMLSKDVVLVDSPGIDVSPDLDLGIDQHCLDADVTVMVVNAESTLSSAEKSFLHKVKKRLSKPNIFFLMNRWEAAASEPDTMELVKNQHLTRSISFLVDELQCVDKGKAEDRVFFVSAKETLMTRIQNHQGMPQGGGAIHAEGFPARQLEFENFECKFEECITKSAIQTKFESHADSGLKIANALKAHMEQRVDYASKRRSKLEENKKEQENRLEYVKEQLGIFTSDTEHQIEEITSKVECQVTDVMKQEIGRLDVLVNEFNHPFCPLPESLKKYKEKLYNYLERGLERNIKARSNSQTQVIFEQLKKNIADRFRSRLLPETPDLAFQVNYPLAVSRLFTDFHEDIEFHFSLDWQAILRKLLGPQYDGLANALGWNRNVQSSVPTVFAVVPGLASLSIATLVIVVGGLTVGWKIIALCGGLYCGVYVIERAFWTNGAKEKAFKRQFVKHASEKLQSVVSFTSANCSTQVERELKSTIATLKSQVQREVGNLEGNIRELNKETEILEKMENDARMLWERASWLENELSEFSNKFGLEKSKICEDDYLKS